MRGVNIMLNQLWVSKASRFWQCLFCSLVALFLLNGLAWGADDANKLLSVSIDSSAATPTVLIETDEPVGYRYTVYDSFEPTRVVIDFPGMDLSDIAEMIPVNQGAVEEIRVAGFTLSSGKLSRVEILLAEGTEYQVNLDGKEFRVAFATSSKVTESPVPVSDDNAVVVTSVTAENIPVDASQDANVLRNVNMSSGQAVLETNGKVGKFQYFALANPPRLVVDVYGLRPAFKERSFSADAGFKQVRVETYNDKMRLVFDASENVIPEHLVEGRTTDILVSWGDKKPAAVEQSVPVESKPVVSMPVVAESQAVEASAPVVTESPVPVPAVAKAVKAASVESINFVNEGGRSVIAVVLSGPAKVLAPVEDNNLVRFEIVNTSISRALRRTIDASAFPSAVTSVTPYTVTEDDHHNVRIAVELKGEVAYALEQDGANIRLVIDDSAYAEQLSPAVSQVEVLAPEVKSESPDDNANTVEPIAATNKRMVGTKGNESYDGELVSIDIIDANIRTLLRLISDVSNLNIVASDNVGGSMTLRLVDVPWDQALDLILTTNGLKMTMDGNIAHVMTLAEFNDFQQAAVDAEVGYQESNQKIMVRETVKIEFVNMDSVKELTSMFEDVSVTTNKATKTVVLFGSKPDVEAMIETINDIDVPEQQVMIEVRIVEAKTSTDLDFGVRWGATYDGSPVNSSSDLNAAALGLGGNFAIAPPSGGGIIGAAGSALGLSFGEFGSTTATLDVRLSALEGSGDVKIVSTPRILTLNGNPATITQGSQIPYTTTDADGSPKTEFIDASLNLTVTPEINPNGSIILDVDLTNDSQGPNVASGGAIAPSIETKTAKSKILVHDGSTTVIGGIFVDSEDDSHSGVPILMDMPILGHLFKSTNKKASRSELLIFITPRIVGDIE